jgi:hypothetical protein
LNVLHLESIHIGLGRRLISSLSHPNLGQKKCALQRQEGNVARISTRDSPDLYSFLNQRKKDAAMLHGVIRVRVRDMELEHIGN